MGFDLDFYYIASSKQVKKSVSLILLICILTYIGGYHLIYTFYQQGLKLEMKAYLKANKHSNFGVKFQFNLSKGEISNPDFVWEEKGEEFKYKNEYYDIVTIEKDKGQIKIFCLKDDNENELEQQLNQINKKEKNSSSPSRYAQLKFFSFFYKESSNHTFFCWSQKPDFVETYDCYLKDCYTDIYIPPPRC